MAAARDQAARILRTEPDTADGEAARDASAALAEQLRAHLSEETVARRPAETPVARRSKNRRSKSRPPRPRQLRLPPRRNRESANWF